MDIFQSKLPVCVTIGLPRFTSRQAGTVIRAFPRNIVELTVITRRDARDIGRRGRMTREDVPAAGKREGCMSELRLIFFRAVIYGGIVLFRIRRLQPCQRRRGGGGAVLGPPLSLYLSVPFCHSRFISLPPPFSYCTCEIITSRSERVFLTTVDANRYIYLKGFI